ncbi:MAG: hypothetical protein AB7K09_06000 [Planctomycetota bacterium]
MIGPENHTVDVEQMRREFDAAFAEPLPPPPDRSDSRGLLVVRIGQSHVALRVTDVAGLHADVRIVPIPGRPDVAGLAGVAERLVLAVALCDLPIGVRAPRPAPLANALIVSREDPGVAFVVDALDSLVHPDGRLALHAPPARDNGTRDPADAADAANAFCSAILQGHPAGLLRVLDLSSLLRLIPAASTATNGSLQP